MEGVTMSHPNNLNKTLDPVEMLNQILGRIWQDLCCAYDASASLPDVKTLFNGADLSRPTQAAKIVIANMLLEVMENIGRFSPWYTRPARAFGLTSLRDPATQKSRWILAPEAVQKWQFVVEKLSTAIHKNYSLIQAMILVDGLMEDASEEDPYVTAHCTCSPPRSIHITHSVLVKAEILCDACMQPFTSDVTRV
jgi:hypothetical protein